MNMEYAKGTVDGQHSRPFHSPAELTPGFLRLEETGLLLARHSLLPQVRLSWQSSGQRIDAVRQDWRRQLGGSLDHGA